MTICYNLRKFQGDPQKKSEGEVQGRGLGEREGEEAKEKNIKLGVKERDGFFLFIIK